MKQLVEKVLARVGYPHLEATEENLVNIYLEYVNNGIFKEVDATEVQNLINSGEITIKRICNDLFSVR
jgi:hypothetical protein